MLRIADTLGSVDLPFKVILIGDQKTGKSNLFERLGEYGKWDSHILPSMGVSFIKRTLKILEEPVNLQFWDIASDSRMHWLKAACYRKSQAVFVLYDITNRDSFLNIPDWVTGFRKTDELEAQIVIVGNKCDLEEEREVSYEEGRLFAEKKNYKFIELSAKTMENVNSLARLIAIDLSERNLKIKEEQEYLRLEEKKAQDVIKLREKHEEKKKSFCAT